MNQNLGWIIMLLINLFILFIVNIWKINVWSLVFICMLINNEYHNYINNYINVYKLKWNKSHAK